MWQNAVPRSGTMPVASYRPPFKVAFEASLDAGFWRFWRGSNIDAFATPMHCAKGPASQAYATRVLSVRLFSALFLSDFCAKTPDAKQPRRAWRSLGLYRHDLP